MRCGPAGPNGPRGGRRRPRAQAMEPPAPAGGRLSLDTSEAVLRGMEAHMDLAGLLDQVAAEAPDRGELATRIQHVKVRACVCVCGE